MKLCIFGYVTNLLRGEFGIGSMKKNKIKGSENDPVWVLDRMLLNSKSVGTE